MVTGNYHKVAKGFTLLEVMIVIVIVGILATTISLSIGDGGQQRKLEEELRRLQALITLAQEESIFAAIELGLYVETEHYEFMHFNDDNEWEPYDSKGPFRQRTFSEGLNIELSIDDEAIELAKPKKKSDKRPQIIILSSGEMTPFTLHFTILGMETQYSIKGEDTGQLTWLVNDEALSETP